MHFSCLFEKRVLNVKYLFVDLLFLKGSSTESSKHIAESPESQDEVFGKNIFLLHKTK